MKTLIRVAAFGAALLLSNSAARAQEPQALVSGMNLERTLAPGESHTYSITLDEGAAVVGEADQHGIDLVIDIVGPDGKTIRTVDSPNGTEGPELIDLTAFRAGTYKLTVRASDASAKPGKYVMKISRVLSVEENGERMAERSYPPAIQSLWHSYVTDPKAIDKLLESRKGKGPVIEPLPGDSKYASVTYLYYGDESTEKVRLNGTPHDALGVFLMTRFLRTRLFFASEIVPTDARYSYGFAEIRTRFAGPNGMVPVSEDFFASDPLNPDTVAGRSVLTMPAAKPQLYSIRNDSVPKGTLNSTTFKSSAMHEDRDLVIYTPPGYDRTKACDLLIVFDGSIYGGHESWTRVPTPTILDNLIAAKKIGPTVAILVPEATFEQRNRDLTGYAPFADFIGVELVAWARERYRIDAGAKHVVVAGSSFGGFSASYCAFMHPETIGNVLSQSGSYWLTKGWQPGPSSQYVGETGFLIDEFKKSPQLPIKFYMEVGRFDSAVIMIPTNRELRDVLQVKGYQVTYNEFGGGHDYVWWRGSLADGLISLIGRKSD
jgi:enterochelin esterase family protein